MNGKDILIEYGAMCGWDQEETLKKAEYLIKKMEIGSFWEQDAKGYSRGQSVKIALARTMMLDKKCLIKICCNNNPKIMEIINKYKDNLDTDMLYCLCANPAAIAFIEGNLNKLDENCLYYLCGNKAAIGIVEDNIDKIDSEGWFFICSNSEAIPLIEKNLDKVS